MHPRGAQTDYLMYLRALPLYARNPAVVVAPIVAAAIQIGLGFLSGPLTDPIGGLGSGIFGLIAQVIFGFAFGVALIVGDNAWRSLGGRNALGSAWSDAKRKGVNILLATIGFFFLLYIAQMIGSFLDFALFGYGTRIFAVVAIFFLIYTIPAAAIGNAMAGNAISASIRAARLRPFDTAILTIVTIVSYYYVGLKLPEIIGPYLGEFYYAAQLLCPSIVVGYIALVAAKQYSDITFGRFLW